MKRMIFALLAVFSLAACAGAPPATMVEDQGSPAKVELLRERATEFWTAFVKDDYARLYHLYDPFFRARMNENAFISNTGAVKYHSFRIENVKVDGNIGHVKLQVVYSVPKMKFKRQDFSKAPTPAEFEELWLFVGDNWYKEYKIEEDFGYARY
jgi:uncharacterized protein YchJ